MLSRLAAGVGVLALAAFFAWLYGNARYHSGALAERVKWAQAATAAATQRAEERHADDARVISAQALYAAKLAKLEPIVLHSREKVIQYAQTDAGRVLCLDVDRVRGIEADASRLGLFTPSIAPGDLDAMLADSAPAPGADGR